jgi:hypothetical protein
VMSHLKLKWRSLFQSGHERVTVSAEVSFFFFFSFQTSYYISFGWNKLNDNFSFFSANSLSEMMSILFLVCMFFFFVFFFLVILYLARVARSFLSIRSGPSGLFYFYFLLFASSYFILFASFSTLL